MRRAWTAVCLAAIVALPQLASAQPDGSERPRAMPGHPPEIAAEVPVIQLYTMGRGEVLFEKFGHAALCLHYPANRWRDTCFNYGTGDFSSPLPLTWGFLRGRANFWVSTSSPGQMLAFYRGLDRTIWRQDLALTDEQALAIERKLTHDALPENRAYDYHHFYDNCTTRLRDIIDDATDGRLRADTGERVGKTFREFGRDGFAEQTWLLVLSDFILGRSADVEPDLWQAMFLPDYLRAEVAARYQAEPVVIYERRGPPFPSDGDRGHVWVLVIALLVALPVGVTRLLRRGERAGVAGSAALLGLFGTIIWLLAGVSTLAELRLNEALLVFMPADFAIPFLRPHWRRTYLRGRLAVLLGVSLLLAVGLFRQPLWLPILVAAVPLALMLAPWRRAQDELARPVDSSDDQV